jgi:hypothetical protein
MKKILLVFVCAVAIATTSEAQVRFGFKGGANFGNLTGDIEGTKMKLGFNAGAVAKISINEAFSVQPELVYSNQGATAEEGDIDIKLHMNYINIPVMFQYNISGFMLETGPQIGFLASAKAKAEGESQDIKDMFKSTDFSWGIGIGYQMSGSGLGLNARYNIGLGKINDSDGDEKVKNSVIQVGLFYMLGGGGHKE